MIVPEAKRTHTPKVRDCERCVICKEVIVGPLYAFNGPCSYACASCLRHRYEEEDRERWSCPEEFDSFVESELRDRAAWAEENCGGAQHDSREERIDE